MKIVSKSVNDTLNIGNKIARCLQAGDIICLFGQLGSGKTVLTKGVALGLGIKKNKVVSPSFVLIRQYHQAKIPIYHLDLYRLKEERDILGLGYEEYLYGQGITVIEWADRLKYLLPKEYLKITLEIKGDTKREIKITHLGGRYQQIIKQLKALTR